MTFDAAEQFRKDGIEGNKAFYVGDPAWHNRGHLLSSVESTEQAWRLANGHEYFKLETSAHFVMPDGSIADLPLKKCFAIVRDDGTEIGHVGTDFTLTQPWEAFKWFEPFIDAGLAKLEAGGTLKEGSRMWALAKVTDSEIEVAKGDPVSAYLLIYTGFDGSLSTGGGFTPIRVVCQNTLAAAIRQDKKSKSGFKLKNTSGKATRLEAIQESIAGVLETHLESVTQYQFLAGKKMSEQAQRAYVRSVFVDPKLEFDDKKDVPAQTETKVRTVIDMIDNQRGLELVPAIRGTAWQAYNAVTQYLTHDAGRTVDARLNAQWFGENVALNNRALSLALTA